MTEREFIFSGCENYPSEFHLANETTVYGIIIKFALYESTAYHFVPAANMREFKTHMDKRDKEQMKRLSSPIELNTIKTAQKISSSVLN